MTSTADRVHFLSLLLNTDIKQRKALYHWLTADQLRFLSEIAFNLINNLPLEAEEKKQFQRKTFFKKLANQRSTVTDKLRIIRRHWRQLDKILQFFKSKLLQAVSITY